MNGPTITQMPTLCAPEKLDRKALIEQVNYLQEHLLKEGQMLHEVSHKLHEMIDLSHALSSHLYALCDSYDAGDQAAVLLQVKKLSERRAEFKKEKVH